MKGFFSKKIIDNIPVKRGRGSSPQRKKLVYSCEDCPLGDCNSPKMEVSGKGGKKILIIGEAPGRNEDLQGKQFVGDSGQLLEESLKDVGIDMREDCWLDNAVACRPSNNETPKTKWIKCCNKRLRRNIDELKPKVILLMGAKALEAFCLDFNFKNKAISTWRKLAIPDKETGSWVIPLYHPSYIVRSPDDRPKFNQDLEFASKYVGKEFPESVDWEDKVEVIDDYDDVISKLDLIKTCTSGRCVFDYETNCLNPRYDKAKIISISVACELGVGKEFHCFSFPFDCGYFTDKEFKVLKNRWIDILENEGVSFIAHNAKFEESWNRNILGVNIVDNGSWHWDTMVGAYLLGQGRRRFSKLEFQAYINFGVHGYDEVMNPYKKSKGKYNKMEQAPLHELLLYGGFDSLFTWELYEKQFDEYDKDDWFADIFDFFMEATELFMDIEQEGLKIDKEYYLQADKKLCEEMDQIFDKLLDSKEVKKFIKKNKRKPDFEKKRNGKYKMGDKDLREMVYYDVKCTSFTSTDKKSLSKDDLAVIDTEFVKNYLRLKKLQKAKGTYLKQFIQSELNGKIYPSFLLNTTVTGRSSSRDPNFQNIPKRDKEIQEICRKGIIAENDKILEIDYKSMEVMIAACYSRDRELLRYLKNPDSDMHRDMACEIFKVPTDKVTKKLRDISKSKFVFPEFYGSYYAQCASDIWNNTSVKELEKFRGYRVFEKHMEKVEKRFWNKFKGLDKWRNQQVSFYREHGYLETLYGFRRDGYMRVNQIRNTNIQSTAFHCLLDGLIELNKIRKQEKWETKIVGQIHDSGVNDYKEDENLFDVFEEVMVDYLKEKHEWLIAPLQIEYEIGDNWFETKEIEGSHE